MRIELASLCPIHAAITARGVPCRCIKVAQVCRAAWSLMWRMPASSRCLSMEGWVKCGQWAGLGSATLRLSACRGR